MGIQVVKNVICTCDRCGTSYDEKDYGKGDKWGRLHISWDGDKGEIYLGEPGGSTLQGKAYLCDACTEGFLKFMKATP